MHLDLEVFGLEDDFGTRDGEFAEAAVAEAATDHDALGLLPGLGVEEAARDVGELLREVLDGAVHDRRGFGVVADENGVEYLLADVFGGSLPNGSSPDLRSGLRHLSRMSRNAPLLARSPRNPSSSFSSMLKLSISTEGSARAPWAAMPVVVIVSSAILNLKPDAEAGLHKPASGEAVPASRVQLLRTTVQYTRSCSDPAPRP